MFRVSTASPVLPAAMEDVGKAEGFVFVCNQAALVFGSDRHTPVASRPVVSLHRHAQRAVVLPCTSQNHASSPDFMELVNDRDVQWTQPSNCKRTFAHYRYEVVRPDDLRAKIGVMPQNARVDLYKWVRSRY